ncbi:ribosomal protein L7/L12 [Roseimaritima ulvae]|uniref:ribosomal protein L7/L12 n=1 Tax=Roseimaritima ulvae TaxID=980254 RepID=UPI0013902C66|nr:ribosomal protein L7/L12 [Roseimaritima ulvae]
MKNETPLVPGTPVLAAFEGDWLKAEVLAAWDSGRHVVHWPELGHLRNQTLGQTHLAISHETLQRLRSNPEAFSPSVKLPLNSLQPPPEGYIVLPDEVSLLPGVPVKVGAWDYTFLRENAGQVSLLYNTSAREYVMPRRRVVIHEEVIGSLKREGAAEKYSKRLQELQSSVTQRLMRSRGPARTYQINIPLPAGYQRITAETPLQVETDCQACWGRRWSPVVVKSLFENGDVGIVWTKWPSTRIERVTRESLIVSDDTLAKLAGDKMPTEATKTPAEPSGTAENFTLVLVNAGDRPVRVIKEVMEIANLDLSMAAQATRELPLELKRGLSSTEAEKWKTKLESVGATVRLDVAK